nr:hypothetical protein [Tanacetum cinerariifolium]
DYRHAIDQQVALDEALVPHTSRLRIGKSNFRLRSDITSKESTLQLVYHVLKRIVNLEYFREMMHICPRLPGQTFDELPFKEEILAFLRFLGHMGEIRKLTDVNIYKLHQPWRSFAAVINKCLSGKSTVYDSLRLSQARILWGMYHKKNVDYAYLLWEDFVYQVEHKDAKKSNEMYYPRNSKACKEYYAVASGAAPPKTKASVRKTKSSFDTTITPPTAAGTRLSTSAKGKQPTKATKAKSLTVLSEVAMTEAEHIKLTMKKSLHQTHISQASGSGADEGSDDDDDVDKRSDDHDDDDQDDDDQDKGNDDDQDTDDEGLGLNVGSEEGQDAEDDEDELYRAVNINLAGRDSSSVSSQFVTSMLNPSPDVGIDSIFELTPQMDVPALTTVASLILTAPTLTPPIIPNISRVPQAPTPPTTAPGTLLQDLPNFGSLFGFDHRLKTLEANFSEFMQTNQFVGAVSSIRGIVQRYMDQQMNEAVKVAVQIQSDRLRDEAQAKNKEFLKNLDENIQKIIKEQVKEQVKVQVSKILPKIKKTVNDQLEAKVLTRTSNSSKTSYVVAADLSKIELKKILIEKMESNKSIHRSDEQRNLYKALVEAYESEKNILDTYRDTVTLKRRHDDAKKDEEPSAGSDRGSKRRREGKESDSTSASKEKATKPTSKSKQWSKSQQKTASESALAEEPMQTTQDLEEPSHQEFKTGSANDQPIAEASQHPELFQQQKKPPTPDSAWNKTLPATYGSIQPWINDLAKQADSRSSFNELMDKPLDWNNPEGQQYLHNLLKPLPLIPNSRGRRVIPFDHFINNDLEYLRGCASSRKYTTLVTKTKAPDYGHIMWIEDLVPRTMWSQELVSYDKHALWGISYWGRKRQQFYRFAVNKESAQDVYSKCRIIAVTELQIVEWKADKSDGRRTLCFQHLSKNVHKKHRNPTAYGRSSARGFIYQNKDKQNWLMRIDELHKFSDGTLSDVRTALDDHLKGIWMKYLPQAIWRKSDKERATAMI